MDEKAKAIELRIVTGIFNFEEMKAISDAITKLGYDFVIDEKGIYLSNLSKIKTGEK